MTDKQIIIDYKNLCENYSKEVGCFGTFDGSCIKEQCFTYKVLQQLQAKEQECEELKKELSSTKGLVTVGGKQFKEALDAYDQLKEQLEAYKMEAEEGKEINAELKAENDYLKHKIFRYEEIFKHSADIIQNPVTAIEVETFQNGVKALGNSLIAEENNKLHKTLTEIKEIAEKQCVCGVDCIDMKQILQKISECEGNDE